MTQVCQIGANKMPVIAAASPGDIRHLLHHLHWLVKLTHAVTGVKQVVELGTRRGDSTRALLAACEDIDSRLHSFDIENCGAHVREITAGMGFSSLNNFWDFTHSDATVAGQRWAIPVAMVFIDTEHLYESTVNEIAAWHGHVVQGGCMAFHDYWLDDPARPHSGHGVKMGVDEFANAHADTWRLETFDGGYDGSTGMAILWRK